jgi:pimeloyl-ACP methyl ester carboxylesterase
MKDHKPLTWMPTLALVVSVLAGCGGAQAEPTETPAPPTDTPVPSTATSVPTEIPVLREFEPADCQFQFTGSQDVECGYLVVPEDRREPDGRMIRLHVAVLRSTGAEPKTDPLVYLQGGPGVLALEFLQYIHNPLLGVLKERDVVFFDQRGVGYSEPSMNCPEYEVAFREAFGADVSSEEARSSQLEALQSCRARLVEKGVKLSAYNSAASAADVHEMMHALGYDRYNLVGPSYGSRLALTIMRDHPGDIRSAVLDSVVPPQVNADEMSAFHTQRAFDLVFERCALDDACNRKFPDVEKTFYSLVEQLEGEPLPVTAEGVTYQVGGDELVQVAHNALFDFGRTARLPMMISDLANGRTVWFSDGLASIPFMPQIVDEGMHYSVVCSEEIPFMSAEAAAAMNADVHPAILAALDAGAFSLPGYLSACEWWGTAAPDPIEDEPVVSDIPTLILSGDYDPGTPPDFGSAAAEYLENSQSYVVTGHGHEVLFSSICAVNIMEQFLEAPEETPDISCLDKLKPAFATD